MQFARASVLAAVSVLSLAACAPTEQELIETYVTEAQEIAEGLVDASETFETLMNAQPDPLAWNDETKAELQAILGSFQALRSRAETMSVPPVLADTHPLLVQSLTDMAAAVEIIEGIALDPSTATEAKADEMTAKAENAEKLANDYVEKLQSTIEATYPEMLEE